MRGALNVGGMTEFNPDANVRLSRKTEASNTKEKKKGCCKS